jgi:hypothetical protein
MSKIKNVTINLTSKQRSALKGLTGHDHQAVVFESNPASLTAKLAPARIVAKKPLARAVMAKKTAAKVLAKKTAAKVLAKKTAARK